MRPIASVARIIGVDQLHVGTVVGKMTETKAEVLENIDACKTPMGNLKPVLPVASGGIHPRLVPALLETFGTTSLSKLAAESTDTQMEQWLDAKAMRQAVDATLKGITLEEYGKTHSELKAALEHWKA